MNILCHRPKVDVQTANCIDHIRQYGFIEWIKHFSIMLPIFATGEKGLVKKKIEELEGILLKFATFYCTDMPKELVNEAEITMVLMINGIGFLRSYFRLEESETVKKVNDMIDIKQKSEG